MQGVEGVEGVEGVGVIYLGEHWVVYCLLCLVSGLSGDIRDGSFSRFAL